MNKIILLLMSLSLIPMIYADCSDLNNANLKHYWLGENDTGGDFVDLIGDYDFTKTGTITKIEGVIDGEAGYTFASGSGYGDGTGNFDIVGTQDRTLCMWGKVTSLGTHGMFMRYGGSTALADFGWTYNTAVDKFRFTGNAADFNFDEVTPTVGQWYHLCAVFDSGTVRTYKDGSATATGVHALDTATIQAELSKYTNEVTGGTSMTQIGFWDDVLSLEEIQSLYNSGDGCNPTTIVGAQSDVYVNNNTLNFTSDGGQICGFDGSTYTDCGPTADTTPSFTVELNGNAGNLAITNLSLNYTTLTNGTYDDEHSICSNTEGNKWSCTFGNALNLGNHTLYLSGKSGDFEMNNFVDANLFNILIGSKDITGYVNNSAGGFIQGVLMTAVEFATNTTYYTTTDANGYYSIMIDNIGEYKVSAGDPGNFSRDSKSHTINVSIQI